MVRPIAFAFDKGQVPTISCVNIAKIPLGVDFKKLLDALNIFVVSHFGPVWGVKCNLQMDTKVAPGNWGLVISDNADQANAFGYHELTSKGLPLSKVFMEVVRRAGEHVAVTCSHEIAEMLVDPALNLAAIHPNGTIFAVETADAPEAYSFKINGIPMTDFVYPSWFEGFRKPKSTQFDHMNLIDRPFKILRGGYMSVYDTRTGWSEVYGQKMAGKKLVPTDKRRAQLRRHSADVPDLKKSSPKTEKPNKVAKIK